jgi:hypothetical protein
VLLLSKCSAPRRQDYFAPNLTVEDVTVLIDRFISKAARSRLEPFVRLGQPIRRHRDGILHAIHQGRTEALNNH